MKKKCLFLIIFFVLILVISVRANSPPNVPVLISPENGSIISGSSIPLDFYVDDVDGDALTVNIYGGEDPENLQLLDTMSDFGAGSHYTYDWEGFNKPPQNTANTLFLARFNGNLISEEGESPLESIDATNYISSKFGEAVSLNRLDSSISYSSLNNFNPSEGTIEFWMSPTIDLSPTTSQDSRWFTYGSGSRGENQILIMWKKTSGSIIFQISGYGTETSYLIDESGTFLEKGKWYHIVFTWNENKHAIYVNGVKKAQKNHYGTPMAYSYFTLGKQNSPKANVNFDEVKILSKDLNDNEVYNEYISSSLNHSRYYWKIQSKDKFNMVDSELRNLMLLNKSLLSIETLTNPIYLEKGETEYIPLIIKSLNHTFEENLTVIPIEPNGYGIITNTNNFIIEGLDSNEEVGVGFTIMAQRANNVNLGKPWIMKFRITNGTYYEDLNLEINVIDPKPGKIFYVLSEDYELKTGQSYGECLWTNEDNYVDHDEAWFYFINKTKAMENEIDEFGGIWTHLTCVGCMYTWKESERLSDSENWKGLYDKSLERITDSVFNGQDIAIHTHKNKDASSDGFAYSWNNSKDAYGLGSNFNVSVFSDGLPQIGNFTYLEYNVSKLSYLYDHLGLLERYGRLGDPNFRINFYRTGSWRAGCTATDEAETIKALNKLKVLGDSDHDGNLPGNDYKNSEVDFGENLFFVKPGDINNEVRDLRDVTILEASPTPSNAITYDSNVLSKLNSDIDNGYLKYTSDNQIKSGIYLIMGFTHNFQMCGEDPEGNENWTSLVGGDFERLSNHIQYVKTTYPDIIFSGANKAVLEYYDYYSPTLIAWRSTEYAYLTENKKNQISRYPIKFIGKDIPIDKKHPHEVSVKYPSYFKNNVIEANIYKNGKIEKKYYLNKESYYPDLNFTVDNSDDIWELEVLQSKYEFPYVDNYQTLSNKIILNIASPYTFRKMNLILDKSKLNILSGKYNLNKIDNIKLKTINGDIYNIKNYIINGHELILPNITMIQTEEESTNTRRTKYNIKEEPLLSPSDIQLNQIEITFKDTNPKNTKKDISMSMAAGITVFGIAIKNFLKALFSPSQSQVGKT